MTNDSQKNIVKLTPVNDDSPQTKVITEHERRLNEKLERALGSVILDYLKRKDTEDIFRNEDGRVWLKQSGVKEYQHICDMSDGMAEAVLRTVADTCEHDITPDRPFLDGVLPTDGSRIHGNIPPATKSATFTIRRKNSLKITLNDYLKQGAITDEQHLLLKEAIREHQNIFVVGGTGSGKTTLVNALMHCATIETPNDRFVIIEDTPEVQCSAENRTYLQTTENRSLADCVKESLRMRPDRIIVGEVRGAEALNLLEIWNTGHSGGIATAHAQTVSAEGAMQRLEMLVSSAGIRHDSTFVRNLIATTVNIVVCIELTNHGRKITSISEVRNYNKKLGKYNFYQLDVTDK